MPAISARRPANPSRHLPSRLSHVAPDVASAAFGSVASGLDGGVAAASPAHVVRLFGRLVGRHRLPPRAAIVFDRLFPIDVILAHLALLRFVGSARASRSSIMALCPE